MKHRDMTWEDIARQKRSQRDSLIEATHTIIDGLNAESHAAVMTKGVDIPNLAELLAQGDLCAEEVTIAYIQRAIIAQQTTNCLTEVLFEDALAQARQLDQHFKTNETLVGPLHGIPMSIKDQFDVAGVDTTLGYVGRSFDPATEDSVLVKVLKGLGAIILTKTNIPQSILWGETENPLWGLTTLPQNPKFTPGGSTGGEAVLLAMRGSLCGWGTDIGGSIRGPGHFNDLFALKPTSSRFPYQGAQVSHEGQDYVPSSVGPMSQDLTSLVSVTKSFLNAEPWRQDPKVTPLPWREDLYQEVQTRPLKIGLVLDDGVVKPHPPIERAVRDAATLLERAGHEIVMWDTSKHWDCIRIMDQFYRADGGEDILHEISKASEPMIPHVASLVSESKAISVYQYWQLNKAKVAAQQRYNEQWNATATQGTGGTHGKCVDIVLSPVIPHTAVPHRSCRWTGYTKIWNFLDYSAMSFPYTTFSHINGSADDDFMSSYQPRNPLDTHNHHLYDPVAMDGLPIGIQIIGRRFEEEKLLGVAEVLSRELEKAQR